MKRIFILLSLLFLTGCSVTYEITINNNKIEEKLILIETNQELFNKETDTDWTLKDTFEALLSEDDEFSKQEYSVKSLSTDTQLGVEYYSEETQELINSSAINQCYTNPKIEVKDNIIYFDTGSEFNCYEYYENLETINIVLKTNHKVILSNADRVDDNKYLSTTVAQKNGVDRDESTYETKRIMDKNETEHDDVKEYINTYEKLEDIKEEKVEVPDKVDPTEDGIQYEDIVQGKEIMIENIIKNYDYNKEEATIIVNNIIDKNMDFDKAREKIDNKKAKEEDEHEERTQGGDAWDRRMNRY